MFDRAEIVARGGRGGDGIVSFRHEKYVPFGGPDGGDGGRGGDVKLKASPEVTTLGAFRHKGVYRAASGEHGKGKEKHGRSGVDLVLSIPVGTVVWCWEEGGWGAPLADLSQPGEEVVVARGGRGGLGNPHFASSTNQAPRIAQKGETGEENSILMELRTIADVGIIGYPNVGKSTLLAAASAAKPKIAGYPFTTRQPVLGAVDIGNENMVIAEIPGLIDGAHLGRGLGHDFLRHVVRTKVLIHVLDGTSVSPAEDMTRLNNELELYDPALAGKPQLVVINKIDLPEVQARLTEIEGTIRDIGVRTFLISAAAGEGVGELMKAVAARLQSVDTLQETGLPAPKRVFRPRPRGGTASVHKEGDIFVVAAPALERIIAGTEVNSLLVRGQLRQQCDRLGVSRVLKKAGVKPGDKVRCGELEWEW